MKETETYLGNLIIHHIGIVVKDINKSIELYLKLGYRIDSNIVIDFNQNNRLAFMHNDLNSLMVELIEPMDETSSVYNFNTGYHHVCYEVEKKEAFFSVFKQLKIGKVFTKPVKAPAINNREIVFACLKNGTFVEFLF